MHLSALQVGPQRQCRHHGNAAQEENDVSGIYLGHRPVQVELIVSPLKLADHPKRAAHGQQHPKKIPAPVRSSCVHQEAGVGEQWHKTLSQISKRSQSMVSLGENQRDARIDGEEEHPDARHSDDGFRR
jgi:hypothetical protein